MKRKTTRLTFTEEELANPNVRRAAQKAARAADRADRAKAKLSTRAPPKRGLKMDTDKAKERSAQLRFGKAEFGEEIARPKRRRPGAGTVLPCAGCRQLPLCGLAAQKHLALQAVPIQQVYNSSIPKNDRS